MNVFSEADGLVPRRGAAILLPDHHRLIEARCRDLIRSALTDSNRDLVASWRAVEAELVDHLDAEEEVILPRYREHAAADAARILDDHVRIRALLLPIGVDIDLHAVRLVTLEQLCDALAAHSLHEDSAMYPWAERELPDEITASRVHGSRAL